MNEQVASNRPQVVIIGGGFGGLNTTKTLRRADVDITLIDRRNFHLFQPLLYQVATGGLSPANISAPLRSIVRRQKNVRVVLGTVRALDPLRKTVQLEDQEIEYDWLVVAAGATHSYFGHDQWQSVAPGLKTIEDATSIRAKILAAFENAEQTDDPVERSELMTFVIVGAGPTGVEMAGAVAELARHTLKSDFRTINPADAKIVLVDGQDRVLSGFPPELSAKASRSLQKLGVQVHTGTIVSDIDCARVTLSTGKGTTAIPTRTVLWAAGVRAASLAEQIALSTGAATDSAGRISVLPDLSIDGYPEIFVIGDICSFTHQDDRPLPGVAPVAIQQGRHVAHLIRQSIFNPTVNAKTRSEFRYRNQGNLATIGRRAAVAELGKLKFSGFFAWLLWSLVHLMQITRHENRFLVFTQWAWNYFTFNRSARLITETVRESDESD